MVQHPRKQIFNNAVGRTWNHVQYSTSFALRS